MFTEADISALEVKHRMFTEVDISALGAKHITSTVVDIRVPGIKIQNDYCSRHQSSWD